MVVVSICFVFYIYNKVEILAQIFLASKNFFDIQYQMTLFISKATETEQREFFILFALFLVTRDEWYIYYFLILKFAIII